MNYKWEVKGFWSVETKHPKVEEIEKWGVKCSEVKWSEVKWSEVKWSEDIWWNVYIIIDL
jgi:hypothetical protein